MIFKKHKKNNFTILDNKIIQNKDLSLQAKGLMALMLSLPEDWDFKKNGLITLSKKIDIKTFNKILDELKENKYLVITKKEMDWQWDIYEEPYTIYQNMDYRYTKNWCMDIPVYDRSQNPSYKELNKQSNNNNNNIQENAKNPTYDDISVFCQENNINIDTQGFIDYYEERNWCRYDKNLKKYIPIKNWKSAIRTWAKNTERYNEEREITLGSKKAYIKEVENKNKSNLEKTNEMFARAEEFKKLLGGTNDNTRNKRLDNDNKGLLSNKENT